MNWIVLKDTKWILLQAISIILAIVGVFFAVMNNGFWTAMLIFSMIFLGLGVARTVKLMNT